MSVGKTLLGFLGSFLQDVPKSQPVLTEEDILKAIDKLPKEVKEPVEVKTSDWYKGANWVSAPYIKCWAEFKYLGKPEFQGLSEIDRDRRIYFTIPLGYEWEEDIKFWFVTFPFGGKPGEIKEFFTLVNPLDVVG